MKMTGIEKRFVNRKKKSERNINKLESALKHTEPVKIKNVLELGCGIGFVSHYLAATYHFNVYGTDFDEDQIQSALQLQPAMDHLHFQVEDATKLSFGDASIDLVLSQNVFHHIPKWEDAIKEIARILCPGGYFIWLDITFPVIIKNIFLPFTKNYGLYTMNDIKTAFENHKLRILSHERSVHGLLSQNHVVLQRS
jgi:ubiquinone/menaquinone biosynthesis C-methylase UbiE